MKIGCEMARDLIPLYLEHSCSAESEEALQTHLADCEACRDMLRRMESPLETVRGKEQTDLLSLAKKVKRRRVRTCMRVLLLVLLVAYGAFSVSLTLAEMERRRNPIVYPVEEGVWNLTAQELTVPADMLADYIFYTNSTKIQVTAQISDGEGRIGLTRVERAETWLLENTMSAEQKTVTFTGLSASGRYILSSEGLEGILVTVSEGREVSFWTSFRYVLSSQLELLQFWLTER